MTFQEFQNIYDKEGAVILLEGKRNVLTEYQPQLVRLGEKLCTELRHAIFRSGNADGADDMFSSGVANIDKDRLELIVPYTSHKKNSRHSDIYYSLENIDMTIETKVVYQTKDNSKNAPLIDKYVQRDRKALGMKGGYLLRDTLKVIGSSSGIATSSFAIFYDDFTNPESGGTGHTMLMCRKNQVPYVDQKTWMKWL